jgi:hypothetical protein
MEKGNSVFGIRQHIEFLLYFALSTIIRQILSTSKDRGN